MLIAVLTLLVPRAVAAREPRRCLTIRFGALKSAIEATVNSASKQVGAGS
jgi:hypothetical protein